MWCMHLPYRHCTAKLSQQRGLAAPRQTLPYMSQVLSSYSQYSSLSIVFAFLVVFFLCAVFFPVSNVHQVVIKPHYIYTRQSQWEREKARKKTPIIKVAKPRIKELCAVQKLPGI